jgi:hypothetical protein
MKTSIPANARSAAASSKGCQAPSRATRPGRLAQLAAMMNQSSRVQAQSKLAGEIQNSERVQNQLNLAAEINQGTVAQPRLMEEEPAQREAAPTPNRTGLPDRLKAGVESLSGISLDDVEVHYNSNKPAQLNALAYAQGTDIHVAPGQEKHLPHEAWHIVQQKQGRVQPTMQMKTGIPVNDNQVLEKEADVMGTKALTAGMGKVDANLQLPGEGTSTSIVQRAVGYEFETGWLVYKEEIGYEQDKDAVMPRLVKKRIPLKKKERVGYKLFEGFKIEADEAAGGNSEIEFIVHPPLPEKPGTLEELERIMGSIAAFGSKLLALKDGSFRLGLATGIPHDNAYVVSPGDDQLKAGPQVTTGIDLAKIPGLSSHKGAGELAPSELRGSLGEIQDTATGISQTKKGSKVSPQLLGLLTLIVGYLQAGRGRFGDKQWESMLTPQSRHGVALNYPKRIAEPLLARTQFGKLFQLIPLEEQIFYIEKPGEWLDLVIQSAGGYELYDPSKPVIERGIQEEENNPHNLTVTHPGPKRIDWILGIAVGMDKLTKMEDSESMGEFGNKTERVGGGGRIEAGIFEFRGAQKSKIPLAQWGKFATDFFKYILTLHDQSLPIAIPQKKEK